MPRSSAMRAMGVDLASQSGTTSSKSSPLFVSGAGRELEVRLGHLLELRGIGLVTGEVGSGKTTHCRKVVSALHAGLYRVFYVPLTTGNPMDMYKLVAWELGLSTERSRAAVGADALGDVGWLRVRLGGVACSGLRNTSYSVVLPFHTIR